MKFAALLRDTSVELPEVAELFRTYKVLKKELKKLPGREEPCPEADASFIAAIDQSLSSMNAMFMEKEEDAVIRLVQLQGAAAAATDNHARRGVYKALVDFHGEVLLLVHWSTLAYTATVKILKKHHKHTGLLLRAPHLEGLLNQPFCSTEVLTDLARRAEQCVQQLAASLAEGGADTGAVQQAGAAVQGLAGDDEAGSGSDSLAASHAALSAAAAGPQGPGHAVGGELGAAAGGVGDSGYAHGVPGQAGTASATTVLPQPRMAGTAPAPPHGASRLQRRSEPAPDAGEVLQPATHVRLWGPPGQGVSEGVSHGSSAGTAHVPRPGRGTATPAAGDVSEDADEASGGDDSQGEDSADSGSHAQAMSAAAHAVRELTAARRVAGGVAGPAVAPPCAAPALAPGDMLRRTQVALDTWARLHATASTPSTVLSAPVSLDGIAGHPLAASVRQQPSQSATQPATACAADVGGGGGASSPRGTKRGLPPVDTPDAARDPSSPPPPQRPRNADSAEASG